MNMRTGFFVFLGICFMLLAMPIHADMDVWWDANWSYRQPYHIMENSAIERTNGTFEIPMNTQTLITEEKMNTTCNDIRVTYDEDILLPSIMITACNQATTTIRFNSTLSASTNQTFYVYYGNNSVSSVNLSLGLMRREVNMTTTKHSVATSYDPATDWVYLGPGTIAGTRTNKVYRYNRTTGAETAMALATESVDYTYSGWFNNTHCRAVGDLGAGSRSSKFECLDPTANATYTYTTSFTSKRLVAGTTKWLDDAFCVPGGYVSSATTTVECYNASTKAIDSKTALLVAVSGAGTDSVGNYTFLFGGTATTSAIQRIDWSINTVVRMANLQTFISSNGPMARCLVNNNDILCYAFGGHNGSTVVNTSQFFNNTANTTAKLDKLDGLADPVGDSGTALIKDSIWLFGGYTLPWATTNKIVQSFSIPNYNITTTLGLEESPPKIIYPISDNTIVCFTILPVCINSYDNSIIYKGNLYG